VYVAGRTPGRIPEAVLRRQPRFSNTYQQSKYEAEQVVTRFASRVPAAIARISSIIGDSRDGRVHQLNHVHQLMRLFPQCALPVAPCEPDALIDVVSIDWVAGALAWLFENRSEAGAVYQLCAGPRSGFTVEMMLAEMHRLFAVHPAAQKWLPVRMPRMVGLSEWDRFADSVMSDGSPLLRELVRATGYYLPHLAIRQEFENEATVKILAPSGMEAPPIRETFARVVAWCLETNWGKEKLLDGRAVTDGRFARRTGSLPNTSSSVG
ncbi:MAG: SDR family oxidoreductase, partial [Bryobacteraceae bacterium]